MFPRAKKLLDKATLSALDGQMEAMKAEYKKGLSTPNIAA